jgi:methionine aminopeptidase
MPRGRKIENGQIIGLDLGVIYEGYYADSARTYRESARSRRAKKS